MGTRGEGEGGPTHTYQGANKRERGAGGKRTENKELGRSGVPYMNKG